MKLSTFIKQSNIPATLIRSVVRQNSDWKSFKDTAQGVAAHGADAGFSGFIYYSENVSFTKRNKKYILEMIKQQSEDFGEQNSYSFIAGFNCLNGDYSPEEIAECFFIDNDARTQVFNALAWYALEEVSRDLADMLEDE